MHHIYTNSEADPDARTSPVLRAHPTDAPGLINKFQHLYIWPLLSVMQYLQIFFIEPIYLATGAKQKDVVHVNTENTSTTKKGTYLDLADILPPLPEELKKERLDSLFLRFLFLLRFVILPIVYVPEWNTVLCICTYISVASLMLGPLFLVAHNFPGVKFCSNNADDEDISFMASQVESACNWGGWIGIQLTGGLSCEYLFYTYF